MPLILDWHPDYWTSDERSQLFDFWRDRYGRHPLNLSPSGAFDGGVGFFDAGLQSQRFRTSLLPTDPDHPLTLAFLERKAYLQKERDDSQPADRHRLQLLSVAEHSAWEWWKVAETYRPRLFDGPILRQQASERIQRHEAVFKDALAQLVEHDRENGHPLADPDRDWNQTPPTAYERRRWLTRRGRKLEPGSEDARLLEEVWKNNESLRKDLGRIAPRPKAGFIPTRLERWHDKQVLRDKEHGITRTKSGVGVRRSLNGDETEKPPAPLVISRAGDLTEKVQHFLTMRDDVRRSVDDIPDLSPGAPVASPLGDTKQTVPTPAHAPEDVDSSAGFLDDILNEIVVPSDLGPVPSPSDGEDITDEDEDGKDGDAQRGKGKSSGGEGEAEEVEEKDDLARPLQEASRRMVAESDQPSWFRHDKPVPLTSFDPAAPDLPADGVMLSADGRRPQARHADSLPDGSVKELYSEALREVLPMKRPTSVDDTFERERRLREITEKWKSRNVSQLSEPEPDNLWDRTVTRVSSFKDRAMSLWSKRVAPSLGLETPQQRVSAQAKAQDLQEIRKLIQRLESTTPKPKAKIAPMAPPPPSPPRPGKRRGH